MDIGPLELRHVVVDDEVVEARPIDWEYENGVPSMPLEYHTTCPKCAARISFKTIKIATIGDEEHVKCPECGAGIENEAEDKELVSILSESKVESFLEPYDFDPVELYE